MFYKNKMLKLYQTNIPAMLANMLSCEMDIPCHVGSKNVKKELILNKNKFKEYTPLIIIWYFI